MSVAFVQGAIGPDGTATAGQTSAAAGFSSTVGIGNTVGGFFTWDSTGGITVGVINDDKGNIATATSTINDAVTTQSLCGFYFPKVTNSPQVITCKPSGGTNLLRVQVFELTRAFLPDGGASNLQTSLDTGTDAITTGVFTTLSNGDMVVGCTVDTAGTSSTIAHGTGFTDAANGSAGPNVRTMSEYKAQSLASGATAATFTIGLASRMLTLGMGFSPSLIPMSLFQRTVF